MSLQIQQLFMKRNCKFYGSMVGCRNGNFCSFDHSNPNSVQLCPAYINNQSCKFVHKCRFRHDNFNNNIDNPNFIKDTRIVLNNHTISTQIKQRYATTVYSFDFENENRNTSESRELKFEITIDPDAFISEFRADIDGEIFIGQTKGKETAAKEYEQAKVENKNAILICQPHKDIPNVFEIKTNINGGSKVSLDITIEQYLKKKFDFNELTIQILNNFECYNIKPNYSFVGFTFDIFDECGICDVSVPSTFDNIIIDKEINDREENKYIIKGKLITNKVQSISKRDDNEWIKELEIGDKIDIKQGNAWHECKVIDVNDNYNHIQVHYIGCDKRYDEYIHLHSDRLAKYGSKTTISSSINELTLKYKIKGADNSLYTLFDNESNTFCHAISGILNDSVIADSSYIVPRRVVFVIDKSGSMKGVKWEKTASATIDGLKLLRKDIDRFNVILFNHDVNVLFDDKLVLSNDGNIDQAIYFMNTNDANGATNIDIPLRKAVNVIKDDMQKDDYLLNQIIFMTDGQVSITKEILININKLNNLNGIDKYNKKISIFTFGVGQDGNDSGWIKDVNHSFLKSLAVNNNGFYQRIKQSNTDTKLSEYFNILSNPIMTNINIKYCNKNITDLTETHFDCNYSGNDMIISGKIENIKDFKDINLSATITATTGKLLKINGKLTVKPRRIDKKVNINFGINGTQNENTKRIWAYLKLQQLTKQKLIHQNDMIEIDDDEKDEEKSLGLELGLKYKFITPWTSMIVVKHREDDNDDNDDDNIVHVKPQQNISYQHQKRSRSTSADTELKPNPMIVNGSVERMPFGVMSTSIQASAPMLQFNPLTAEMLQDAKPAEKKRLIGERLFPKIQVVEPRLAGKITGMLLELDNIELLQLLSDERGLMERINQALTVLKQHLSQRNSVKNQLPPQPNMVSIPHSISQLSVNNGTASVPMIDVAPLTVNILKGISDRERDRIIGERLFPKIQAVEPKLAGKITGMLLQLDNDDLLLILSDNKVLMKRINEAIAVLKDHQLKQSQKHAASQPNDNNEERNSRLFEVYNKHGILIRFYILAKRVLAVIENINDYEIIDFEINLDLPKCVKLKKLKPLKEYKFKLTDSFDANGPFIAKMEIKFVSNGRQIEEKQEIKFSVR